MPFCLINLPVCFILYLSADREVHTTMDSKALEELRNKYIKNPPEGMTAKPVKNMSDSDLLDMHYVLTEDDDRDGDETQEGFYNRPLSVIALFLCPLLYGLFLSEFLRQKQLRVLARMVV